MSVEGSGVRGRPRDPRADRDIMSATRELLAAAGYEQISIESIAKAAGVSRPTVYRRWPSKAHLVFDAAFGHPGDDELPAQSGDFDTDLRTFVSAALTFWRDPVVEAAALGILAERRRDPELHIRTQQLLDERTVAHFRSLARSGIEQGVVDPAVDVDAFYQLVIGTTFYQAQVVMDAGSNTAQLAERLCSLVIQGVRAVPNRKKAKR
ncbi:TetR/AcrR family transcriptional regulator [Mycolicibacterium hippocampi]|uniref:TetR/AcrR family transcriptional regulator n=1 Tax=Mycolicibacterium hippocampi TaxID=659824 RepID=UPI0035159DD0